MLNQIEFKINGQTTATIIEMACKDCNNDCTDCEIRDLKENIRSLYNEMKKKRR